MMLAFWLLQAATAATTPPSPEAVELGARVARGGSIMALLPIVAKKDSEELIAAHPELSEAEKARLRETAAAKLRQGMARIETAFGTAYAKRLTVAELRALAVQVESPEQRRLRAVQPQVMMEALGVLGSLDYKKDVETAFCRDTGKLCAKASPAK